MRGHYAALGSIKRILKHVERRAAPCHVTLASCFIHAMYCRDFGISEDIIVRFDLKTKNK
jgi:hypothetical protein